MRSMTGYGSALATGGRFRCGVSVRSVNHRQLDVVLRLPEFARSSERGLERRLAARLARGRVEVQVDVRPLRVGGATDVAIDLALLQRLDRALGAIEDRPWLDRRVTLGDLLRLPGVIQVEQGDVEWGPEDEAELMRALEDALDEVVAFRESEGSELRAAVAGQLAELETTAAALRARRPAAVAALGERLAARLEQLLAGAEVDPARLAQEVALLAERADVEEELDRLDSHLGRLRECLDSTEPVGRRLDFVSQEVLRELNTLGSKSRDDEMSGLVLEGKLLCDRLREQAQNIE